MLRFLIVMILVFALPFLIWRLRAAMMTGEPGPMPVGVLSIIGTVAAGAAMVTLAALSIEGTANDGAYQPPSLDEGEIRPGRFEDGESDGGSDQDAPDRPALKR